MAQKRTHNYYYDYCYYDYYDYDDDGDDDGDDDDDDDDDYSQQWSRIPDMLTCGPTIQPPHPPSSCPKPLHTHFSR